MANEIMEEMEKDKGTASPLLSPRRERGKNNHAMNHVTIEMTIDNIREALSDWIRRHSEKFVEQRDI